MKNKQKTILCMLIAIVFLIPLMGNTAMGTENTVEYIFNSYVPNDPEEWTDEDNLADGNSGTYAYTSSANKVVRLDENQCNGFGFGTITKVKLSLIGYYTGLNDRDIILQPIFYSTGLGEERNFNVYPGPPGQSSGWIEITNDENRPETWTYEEVANLDCYVKSPSIMSGTTLFCSMVLIQVTYET